MKYEYTPVGTCSRKLVFDIEDDRIKSLEVTGGCPGNLLGISRIVKGMTLDEVIEDFEGVTCDNKKTSCPDQIAQALKKIKADEKN